MLCRASRTLSIRDPVSVAVAVAVGVGCSRDVGFAAAQDQRILFRGRSFAAGNRRGGSGVGVGA